MKPLGLKLVRGLLGPLVVIAALLGIGYGAVALEHSLPAHPSVVALSLKLVKTQGPSISDWNMTLKNNGTITAILGPICQQNFSANHCTNLTQYFLDPTTPFYIEPGHAILFELAGVSTAIPTFEFHVEIFAWTQTSPPSISDTFSAPAIRPPTTEWISYNSTSNSFIQ